MMGSSWSRRQLRHRQPPSLMHPKAQNQLPRNLMGQELLIVVTERPLSQQATVNTRPNVHLVIGSILEKENVDIYCHIWACWWFWPGSCWIDSHFGWGDSQPILHWRLNSSPESNMAAAGPPHNSDLTLIMEKSLDRMISHSVGVTTTSSFSSILDHPGDEV